MDHEDGLYGRYDEEPEYWDEHRWEEHFRESDMRTDKYCELLDKYMDHPDRDEIIAREMGWDFLSESDEDEEGIFGPEITQWEDPDEGEGWKADVGFEEPYDDRTLYRELPVYKKAFQYSIDAMDLLKGPLKGSEDDSVRMFAQAVIQPPAKIAGASSMGMSQSFLGGNIAKCKRGLIQANRMLRALQEILDKGLLEPKTFYDFYSRGKEVRDDLAIHIVELRERFNRGIP
jgi:hypothetical protein